MNLKATLSGLRYKAAPPVRDAGDIHRSAITSAAWATGQSWPHLA
jgi:hypothetical protein